MWNSVDAPRFPLSRAARDADVVIDLLSGDPGTAGLAMDRPEGSVISCTGLDGKFLAAPGLLLALAEHPPGTFELGLGLCQVCADAVAAATPIPAPAARPTHDQGITDDGVAALHRAASRPEVGNGESRWVLATTPLLVGG